MLQPCSCALVLAALLVSLTASAQTGPARRAGPRSIVLTGKAGEAAPVLYLAPGSVTSVLLDGPIVRESVEVDSRAHFARVDPGEQVITLALHAPLGRGERLALRFAYREGSPREAVFLLTARPGEVDEVVNVTRPPQTLEACHAALAGVQERCEAQARELEALRARPLALSPAAVALSGFVNPEGLKGEFVRKGCAGASDELRAPEECWVLGGTTWSVVVLEVSNTGAEPWVPAWAEVTPLAGGEPRRARVVLSRQAALSPGETVSVAIEVEMPLRKQKEGWLEAPHALRVCDASGSRCLSVSQANL